MTKPITIWMSRKSSWYPLQEITTDSEIAVGFNPWKVITILNELDVPFVIENVNLEDVKKPPYTDINPNGRVPGR